MSAQAVVPILIPLFMTFATFFCKQKQIPPCPSEQQKEIRRASHYLKELILTHVHSDLSILIISYTEWIYELTWEDVETVKDRVAFVVFGPPTYSEVDLIVLTSLKASPEDLWAEIVRQGAAQNICYARPSNWHDRVHPWSNLTATQQSTCFCHTQKVRDANFFPCPACFQVRGTCLRRLENIKDE
jgi:hypothetical protein